MNENKNFFRASAADFKKIPGSPVAYWVGESVRRAFANVPQLENFAPCKQGIATANNDLFLKRWFELSFPAISFAVSSQAEADEKGVRWLPYNKGGEYRKWYGNKEFVINWSNNGDAIRNFVDDKGKPRSAIRNENFFYRPSCTWSDISSSYFGARYSEGGTLFDGSGHSCFPPQELVGPVLALLCSKLSTVFLKIINPTMHFQVGNVAQVPFISSPVLVSGVQRIFKSTVAITKADWDAYETSWDFAVNPLVAMASNLVNPVNPVEKLYAGLREKWARDCEEMRRLETENNRIFIEAYGLQDELTPEVPWHEITLTCNPWYRYGVKEVKVEGQGQQRTDNVFPRNAELEERLETDTVKELVSYAVGCMMGRYSLEKPGLILADQGSSVKDYYEKIGCNPVNPVNPVENGQTGFTGLTGLRFEPDEDGIIPVLDNDWFSDDIVTRFREFVKVAFGEANFFENMAWIEEALGKDIRSYFTKDFYKDHLQRYQNRPIYWLFQSPKGAFRALVYMHRYKPDMVGGVLGYLRSLQTKVDNQLDVAMQVGADESKSASERVRANKDAVKYAKAKKELDEYEKNVLYPLSTERIEIDLDDGVKVNYKKFGVALRKVTALEGKGE